MSAGNGNSLEYNRQAVETLVFPDNMPEHKQEEYRDYLRKNPEDLDFVLDVPDFHEFIMATSNVARETKEQVVAGMKHYIGESGTAYALMVGLYMAEVGEVIPDRPGFVLIFNRMSSLRVYGIRSTMRQ